MNSYQKLNRILCLVPALGLMSLMAVGLIGTIYFGEMPVYGVHPDPYSLGISWITIITAVAVFICFLSLPISIFLAIDALFNRIFFSKMDKLCWFICLLSISMFIIFKFQFPAFFSWIWD